MRVLVVDDEPINREVAAAVLAAEGHVVTTCDDGAAAVHLCVEQQAVFDMVLMDLLMPVMDGYEAMRRLRAHPRTAKLPILCVSAKPLPEDARRALSAGGDHFLAKPYRRAMLVAAVAETLERGARRDGASG